MKIAIVILNWNGKKLLEKFLPFVILHSDEASVYVADNASTDESVSYIKANFPTVHIIQNKTNGGFSKGYNDALQHVDADVYCLLNNDVEVTRDWLVPIIKTFNSEPQTAIIQPKLLDYNNKDYFEYAGAAGGFIDKFGYPYCRGRIFNTVERDSGQYDENSHIFWASGACFFVRSQVYDQLNGLDETFFAHMEEVDFCWRAKHFKHDIKYVHESVVYHVGGATLSNSNPKKTFLNFRNSLFALTKNAKGNLLFLIFVRLILDGIAGIKFLFEFKFMHTLGIIKAHFSFYSHLPRLISQRKQIYRKANYYQKTSIIYEYFIIRKTVYKSL
ncbi:glycosyltransferase family 2 protein [Changchengzhania lutea]|uniref:glycosyltransferase family 2 protein n=1 Tax=Changchengzhania lutea TaxID=2049305 RepID=UPI00115EF191|nr:glycosyltransferase family 2 protein [Changchengzhania lutea]